MFLNLIGQLGLSCTWHEIKFKDPRNWFLNVNAQILSNVIQGNDYNVHEMITTAHNWQCELSKILEFWKHSSIKLYCQTTRWDNLANKGILPLFTFSATYICTEPLYAFVNTYSSKCITRPEYMKKHDTITYHRHQRGTQLYTKRLLIKMAAIPDFGILMRIFICDLRNMPRLIPYGVQIHFIHAFLRCQCTRYIHLIWNSKWPFMFLILLKIA